MSRLGLGIGQVMVATSYVTLGIADIAAARAVAVPYGCVTLGLALANWVREVRHER